MQQGDLVTSSHAPEGVPMWVGLVVQRPASSLADVHMDGRIFMRVLGDAADNGAFTFYERTRYRLAWADDLDVRPITDAEAVGLAEMLSGGRWEPFAGESWSLLGSGDDDAVVMLAAPHQWRCLPAGSVEFVGRCHNIDHGKALASRALIAYTIRGQP